MALRLTFLVVTVVLVFSQPVIAQDSAKKQARSEAPSQVVQSIHGAEVACLDNVAGGYPCNLVNLTSFTSVADLSIPLNTGSRETNDIWGWTDPETGVEYAIVGMDNGTIFVDLMDPENPEVIGFLPTKTRASIWRDVKVYQNHAFIVADAAGSHGIQILDLTILRTLTEPTELQETANYSGIASAHNIVINEETGFAYSVGNNSGGNTCSSGLHMVNIQDPQNPVFAGCFAHANTGRRGTGYTHDAQCVVYNGPDAEHQGKEICIGSNETDISIADVTDKENPVPLSKASYPEAAYIHQGWLTEDHRYFIQDDELDESRTGGSTRTIIWDLSDLDDPLVFDDFFNQVGAFDHNQYVRGNLLFQSNYTSGLRIWSIADITNPQLVAFFDSYPASNGGGFAGSWSNYPYFESGLVIISSISEGLFVLNPEPSLATSSEDPEVPTALSISAPYPNPVRGHATIDVQGLDVPSVEIEIVDMLGRVVKATVQSLSIHQVNQSLQISTSDLAAGNYMVRVRAGDTTSTHPLAVIE